MTKERPIDPPLPLETQQIRERAREKLFGNNYDANRYKIRRKLGAGGQGGVYVAHDIILDCEVALKQFHTSAYPAGNGVLKEQARVLARLRGHPNVVTIYDFFEQEGMAVIVMELIAGPNLRQWQSGAHVPQEIVGLYRQAGRGLEAAHRAGIVHGDFKPDNVLIDEHRVAKVTDFGVVPIAGARQVGTKHYMAPEQLAGNGALAASDQYSFCLSLKEALQELAARASGGDLPDSGLDRIVSRGLAERPGGRHSSMAALLAELSSVLEGV